MLTPQAMTNRQEWEQATAGSRRLAIAADTELRRRHPHRKIEPLRSAEPAPASGGERQHPDLTPQQGSGETARMGDLTVQRQGFRAAMNEHRQPVPGEDPTRANPRRGISCRPDAMARCDLAATQTADHPISGDPPGRR
jgi:hypothetical protein